MSASAAVPSSGYSAKSDAGGHEDGAMVITDGKAGPALEMRTHTACRQNVVADRKNDAEFVAADARHQGVRPDGLLQFAGDRPQGLVTDEVAVGIVDHLQMIHVDEEDAGVVGCHHTPATICNPIAHRTSCDWAGPSARPAASPTRRRASASRSARRQHQSVKPPPDTNDGARRRGKNRSRETSARHREERRAALEEYRPPRCSPGRSPPRIPRCNSTRLAWARACRGGQSLAICD